jgi:hypothetical protein
LDERYNSCRSDFEVSQKNIGRLSNIKGTCLDTLQHVSETMELLSSGFVSKHNISQNFSIQLVESRKNIGKLRSTLSTREQSITQLNSENEKLKSQVRELNSSLNNVNGDKQVLQNKLGVIQVDMDGLKSNTSRLLVENAGLEKVLNVKEKLEDRKIEAAEQVLDLASKKGIKKIRIITDDEDIENDSVSNETLENDTKEIEKVVEKNIRKMAKSNKDKLKPILDVLSKKSTPDVNSSFKLDNIFFEDTSQSGEDGSDKDTTRKQKNSSGVLQLDDLSFSKQHEIFPRSGIKFASTDKHNIAPSNINIGTNTLDLKTTEENNQSEFITESPLNLKSKLGLLPSKLTPESMPPFNVQQVVHKNENTLAEINTAMKSTKKKIRKLKQSGQILTDINVDPKSEKRNGGSGDLFADKENNDHGAINAKEASQQIAKIVKELPNLVKI